MRYTIQAVRRVAIAGLVIGGTAAASMGPGRRDLHGDRDHEDASRSADDGAGDGRHHEADQRPGARGRHRSAEEERDGGRARVAQGHGGRRLHRGRRAQDHDQDSRTRVPWAAGAWSRSSHPLPSPTSERGLPEAKPKAGFDLSLAILEIKESGPGTGELVPAAHRQVRSQAAAGSRRRTTARARPAVERADQEIGGSGVSMSNTHTAPFRPVRVVSGCTGWQSRPDPGVAQPGRAEVGRRMAGRPPAKRADRSERASVREELARIDASGDFDAPRCSRELLRFLGRGDAGRPGSVPHAGRDRHPRAGPARGLRPAGGPGSCASRRVGCAGRSSGTTSSTARTIPAHRAAPRDVRPRVPPGRVDPCPLARTGRAKRGPHRPGRRLALARRQPVPRPVPPPGGRRPRPA